jgi:hypothetical protein
VSTERLRWLKMPQRKPSSDAGQDDEVAEAGLRYEMNWFRW